MTTTPPDDFDGRRASMEEALRDYNQRQQMLTQAACPHSDHEHGVCIECGADITDDLISRAEAAADAREDR